MPILIGDLDVLVFVLSATIGGLLQEMAFQLRALMWSKLAEALKSMELDGRADFRRMQGEQTQLYQLRSSLYEVR